MTDDRFPELAQRTLERINRDIELLNKLAGATYYLAQNEAVSSDESVLVQPQPIDTQAESEQLHSHNSQITAGLAKRMVARANRTKVVNRGNL